MRPNIVVMMTDNQGAWTLGCYGNPDIRTPNIDRLAAEGMRMARTYCVNSVCSPSRATFFTGLIPSQHGVHCWLGREKPDAQLGPEAYSTIREFPNLPRILADEGYACGLAGKWHLGAHLEPQEGFGYWFTKTRGHTHTFYGDEVVWQGKVEKEPGYITDAITEHAVTFLKQQSAAQPFFLHVGFNAPYGLGASMLKVHENRHTAYYADKELPSFPRGPIHPWLHNNRDLINNPVSIRGYAAAVSGVDDGVGRILETLAELGLDENTLVVFTADQGWCGGQHGMWGMGDHSRPFHTFEETVQIPLIYRHAGRIRAGATDEKLTGNYDCLQTILEHVGLEDRLPDAARMPGSSYAPSLRGEPQEWDDVVFHEFEFTRMIRTRDWKYTRRHPTGPDELYDMAGDPGEHVNRVHDPKAATVLAEMRGRLEAFFERYADPQYDLWKGGTSKSALLSDVAFDWRDEPWAVAKKERPAGSG